MTANLEAGGYIDTDTLLRERMVPTLGAEATERFFAALDNLSLTKRTKAIARQAKVLDMLTVSDKPSVGDAPKSTDDEPVADVIQFQEAHAAHVRPEIETNETVVSGDAVDDPVDLDEPAAEQTGVPVPQAAILQETVGQPWEKVPIIPLSASRYIDSFTGKSTSALLDLRKSDKDAVIKAILAMNEPLDKRMKPNIYAAIVGGVYDGLTDDQIAEMMRHHDDIEVRHDYSNAAIWQRKNKIKTRALELAERNGIDPEQILRRFVKEGRASNPNAPLPLDEIPDDTDVPSLLESATAEVTDHPQATENEPTAEKDTAAMLVAIHDDLTRLADKEKAGSVTSLLIDTNFDEERMLDGRSLLGEMMRRYMPNTETAREIIGIDRFRKDAYKVLVQLSGMNGTSQGERPVTLPMILKYNRLVSEGDILGYTKTLLAQAKADPDYEVTTQKNHAPVEMLKPATYAPRPVVEKVSEPPLPDLWDAAAHNKPLPNSDAERAIKHILEDAVRQDQLRRTDVVFLTGRLLEDDRRGILNPDEEATLLKLAQMQRHIEETGYSKLDESPECKRFFREFTTVSKTFGAPSVSTITDRANYNNNRGNKVRIRQSAVSRKIAAAIQVVLEESRKS